jgi:hypothetical protein
MSALGQKRHSNRPIREADIGACPRDVRFTPESGHRSLVCECPLCAKSGHIQCSYSDSYSQAAGTGRPGNVAKCQISCRFGLRPFARCKLLISLKNRLRWRGDGVRFPAGPDPAQRHFTRHERGPDGFSDQGPSSGPQYIAFGCVRYGSHGQSID